MRPKTLSTELDENSEKSQFVIAEYKALRDEIMKRSEFRYQILSLTLVVAGSLLTFGLQSISPAHVLFVFPIIGCFLSGIWAHNVIVPRQLSAFIRDNVESKYGGWGWETTVEKEWYTLSWLSGIISTSGMFLGLEIISFVLGLLKSTFILTDIVLIAIDSLAIIITLIILRSTMQKPKKKEPQSKSKMKSQQYS